jgi:hypothetical protein
MSTEEKEKKFKKLEHFLKHRFFITSAPFMHL